jgi:peptide/nickel transport system substrate-binding protein
VAPVDTSTPVLPKELTICQAEEPNTLFIYGQPSRSARNVLEAIYDGPIDALSYRFQPVVLEKLPALTDGDASLRTVQATEGETIVDANSRVAPLRSGLTVLNADGQTTVFQGGTVTMTQMVVTFTLRSDATWADGTPLSADDSRYSFELAGQFEDLPLRLRLLHEQTQGYQVVDERTVVWTSVPGYRDTFYFQGFYFQNFYAQNFYHPLPRHIWGSAGVEQLLSAEVVHQKPLGWGPFVVEEWIKGQSITLVPNPNYFRRAEGLPHLDRVIIRFVPSLRDGVDMLLQGGCDLITQDVIEREAMLTGSLMPLLEAAGLGKVVLISSPSSEWEHLDFGITQAEWSDRPNFFGDVRTRQAVAMCIHRERIAGEALPYSEATVADSYVATDHPLYAVDQLYRFDYNPSQALSLLEEIGWRDDDGDGIREAYGVHGIASGTPFSVTLLTNSDHLAHQRTSQIITENMAACGIDLQVQYLPGAELFADGPDGPVFGRQFDLVLFSWLNDLDAPCWLYLSSEIPTSENWWATSNNPGYASPDFDRACQAALDSLPGTDAYGRFHREAQVIFSHDLPVLPLYFVPKLVAVRPGVVGVRLDPTQYLDLWGIEAFDVEPVLVR